MHTYVLANSRDSANSFMDSRFTSMHHSYLHLLDNLIILRVVNGRAISSRQITHYVKIII